MERELTATFGDEDFEMWWKAGAGVNHMTPFPLREQRLLFDNCLYLSKAEGRTMTQSRQELHEAIAAWADRWNARIGKS